jgi:hypothetical protein
MFTLTKKESVPYVPARLSDFAAIDFEVDFKGRGTEEDLTDRDRAKVGF